jgi:phosphoserine aminotransferase
MVSFYPGPSRIHDEIPSYVKAAVKEGVMSINHRSKEFVIISKKTVRLLRKKLIIPKDYTVFFTSSATECWEIIAQSLITEKSYHFFNGAFGKKWFEYTLAIQKNAEAIAFHREEEIVTSSFHTIYNKAVCCFTQNETSNGTQIHNKILKSFRIRNPNIIVAVDATSSMAGIKLDFKQADVWFASVQKCFGLPAGLALMICSPNAIKRSKEINENKHYNSLVGIDNMMAKFQTTHTPNVLGIYLLMRVLEAMKPINEIHKETVRRYTKWEFFFNESSDLKLFIKNPEVRSLTVLPIEAESKLIEKIKRKAKDNGFLLGEGYGDLQNTTFRIANFPALKDKEIKNLQRFLNKYKT